MVQVTRSRRGKHQRIHAAKRLSSPARALSLPIQNAEAPKVSVIIPVMNERNTIRAVIAQCSRVHAQTEVIVVANGSTDGTEELARAAGARVVSYKEPLGHDVGRSIGAMHARGEILLFTDGDMVISARDLHPFVAAVEAGADIALNAYSGNVNRQQVHSVVMAKYALNALVGQPELKGMSLTAVPHAMSRQAAETIGLAHLTVPPLAHAMACVHGLNVTPARLVEVGSMNPLRLKRRKRGRDPLEHLIIGDHLEAINWVLSQRGPRGDWPDQGRRRDVVR